MEISQNLAKLPRMLALEILAVGDIDCVVGMH